MKALTLEQIAPYATTGVLISCSEDGSNAEQITGIRYDEKYGDKAFVKSGWLYLNQPNIKLHLRPLSHLTKPIKVNDVEVIPIVELAKIAFPNYNQYEIEEDGLLKIGKNLFLNFTGLDFFAHEWFNRDFNPINVTNQLALFQWLYKNHFALNIPDELYLVKQ